MKKTQTIREALDEKRVERKGNCTALALCKWELFYLPDVDFSIKGSVYPVSRASARKEAEWFGIPWEEA